MTTENEPIMTPTSAHFALFYDDSNGIEYNVLYLHDASALGGDVTISHAGTAVSLPLHKLEWLRDVLSEIAHLERKRKEESSVDVSTSFSR